MNEKSNNNEINSEKYWENRFLTGDWEKKEGREQSLFFYETALKFLPDWFVSDIEKNSLSICDLGCAEGEGVKLFGDKFKNSRVVGSDISEAALERAKNHYPDYEFIKEDVSCFKNSYDIIFSSNTFEHFENATDLIKKMFKSCKKYLALLLPFKEYERIDEHFFTFDYEKFPLNCEGFGLVFFREINTAKIENTQWPGKEILVIYQKTDTSGYSERSLCETGAGIDENVLGLEKTNAEKDKTIEDLKRENEEKNQKIKQLDEKIEEDRNAIMQIQFEAKQYKQAEIDSKETYVWRTGLKIEKLLQKTGIAFIRSLLVLSDYKRIGFLLALKKGLNEVFHRENTAFSKRRKISLCKKKFLRYKNMREETVSLDLNSFEVCCEEGLVSVVLPVYNGEKVIGEAIESVLRQSYKNFELIIVNDGSNDKTGEIIERFAKKDSRIIIINQENKKLPSALSEGFRIARGEFLTWTSADNIMLGKCIEILVENLRRKPSVSMVYGNMRIINKDGKTKRGHFWFEKPLFSGNVCLPNDTSALNTYANNTIGAAFMYRMKTAYILEDYSKYKTTLEDYDYWMRINSLLKIEHIDEEQPIYLYRMHNESLTAHDRELGITKNRYKLMVLDDFRRDAYMAALVWVAEAEDSEWIYYKEFLSAAENAGHLVISKEEALEMEIPKRYSCLCYVYFGNNPERESLKKISKIAKTVIVSNEEAGENSNGFDMVISAKKGAVNRLDDFRGVFYADSGKAVFSLCDCKIKNKILYELESITDDPETVNKKISIIICTYLRGEKLIDAIWSVIRQSMSKKEYEIIIVDNAPKTSNIREQIRYFQNKYSDIEGFIRYIPVLRKGLSYARNAGMWNADGEYLVFLDDDVLADYYLLEEIYSAFKYHPNVGIVGGQVILDVPFPKPKVLRKGWESLWSQFKISESTFREVTQQFEFPYGANYAVKREAIRRAGGFRMCYGRVGNDFAGGEETALAFKMLEIGYGIGLQPGAKVLHRVDHSRFNPEHVKKTIRAGIITTYRFFQDLNTSVGWTKRYVKNQIKICEKEIRIFERKKAESLDIYYKRCHLEAWKALYEYMTDDEIKA